MGLSMNWKYLPEGNAFKINKHAGIFQTLKYIFLFFAFK